MNGELDAGSGTRNAARGKPSVAIVDYRAGNITSVVKGLASAGADAFLTRQASDIHGADAIVIPGVGNFSATRSIEEDMRDALRSCAGRKPILGICLGMQFLFAGSEEAPDLEGLGLLPGCCFLLRGDVKVPHVGWNTVGLRHRSDILDGVADAAYFYFTHSYAAPVADAAVGTTTHGADFAAIVDSGAQVFGVQFHPEKSGEDGLRILRNFAALC